MSRIKDFFYDRNDIIVTLIILLIAAIIIYFRVGAIMNYPNTLVDTPSGSDQPKASAPAAAASEPSATAAGTTVIISAGDTTAAAVAQDLETKLLVPSAAEFQSLLAEYNLTEEIKAGTYEVPANATEKQIIELITQQTISD